MEEAQVRGRLGPGGGREERGKGGREREDGGLV